MCKSHSVALEFLCTTLIFLGAKYFCHSLVQMAENQITKEFLESILKCKIDKFTVNSGSCVGDGYTCTLFAVNLWRNGSEGAESVLIKTYPAVAARQTLLECMDIFVRELRVYDTIIPELLQFQVPLDVPVVKPPMAPFIAGQFVEAGERSEKWTPVENCIVMTDLRESGNFRLRDRFLGFDLDHYKLAIEAHATLHALSWVYKNKCLNGSLEEKFPFLTQKEMPGMKPVFKQMLEVNCETATKIVNDAKLSEGIAYLKSIALDVCELYFGMVIADGSTSYTKDTVLRVKNPIVENEEPWLVLLHGDAWSNNMMFRYDEKTGKAVEVILVDLQITREGDPMADLVYNLYVSTTKALRQKHLTSMLHVYFDTFTDICQKFSVPTLPGWSWEELNRRFHRAKIFGGYMAVCLMPLILKNSDELVSMDEATEGNKTMEDLVGTFSEFNKNSKDNAILTERLHGVIQDLMNDGVL